MTTLAVERLRALYADGEARPAPAAGPSTVSGIRPPHVPPPESFAELLRSGVQHLDNLAAGLVIDAPSLRAQLLVIAAQAGGVERLARRFLGALPQEPA